MLLTPVYSTQIYINVLLRTGGQFRCNITTHRHTPSRSFFVFFLHMQTTHTHAAHSRDASACGQLHPHPLAVGSEVIMRARSICSLTPAVYLDYRNINRPGLTGSLYQTTKTHSSQSDWQKHGLMLTYFRSLSEKNKTAKNSERMKAIILCCFGDLIDNF